MYKKSNILIVIQIAIVYILIGGLFQFLSSSYMDKAAVWDDNLTARVTCSDGTVKEYRSANFPLVDRGDRAEIYVSLPADKEIDDGTFCFGTYYSAIKVLYKNQVIYSYGEDRIKNDKFIGAVYVQAKIPDEAWGDRLTVQLDVQENNAFSQVIDTKIIPSGYAYTYFLGNNTFTVVVFMAVLIISLIGLLLVLIRRKFNSSKRKGIYILLFTFVMSVWILSNYGSLNLLIDNTDILMHLEFISLYVAPIPLLMYLYEISANRLSKTVLSAITGVVGAFFVVSFLLNWFTKAHYGATLPYFHVLVVVSLTIITCVAFKGFKEKKETESILLRGIMIFLVFMAADVVRYNLEKYFNLVGTKTILPLGVLLFIVTLAWSYIIELTQNYVSVRERRQLLKLAHTDIMTDIANRAACDEKLEELRSRKVKDYAIAYFDLNDLKEINDTLGHDKGDELILSFSKILKDVFAETGFCGRMGGDEFIVLLEGEESERIDRYVKEVGKKIQYINRRKKHDFKISVAVGTVVSSEKEDFTIDEAMKIVDRRMYENKNGE